MALIPKMMRLKLTKKGYPQHPLYVAGDTVPLPFGDGECF